jgi:hypothetical protein
MGGTIHVLHKIEDALETIDFGYDDGTPNEGAKEMHLFKQSGDPPLRPSHQGGSPTEERLSLHQGTTPATS